MGSLPTRAVPAEGRLRHRTDPQVLRRGQALPAGLRGSKSLPWEATQEFRDQKTSQGAPAWGREGADVGLKAAGSTAPRPLTSSSSVPKVASASLPSSPTEQGCFSRLSGSRNAVRSWAAPGKGSGRAAAAFPQPSRGAHSYWRSVPCLRAGLPGTDSHGISSFPDPHGPAGAGGLQRNQDVREERTESIQQILS